MTRPSSLASLAGIDDAAGEQQIARAFVTDLPRQKDGNDRGQKTDFDFGVAEFRFGHGEREVAQRGDAAAAGERVRR